MTEKPWELAEERAKAERELLQLYGAWRNRERVPDEGEPRGPFTPEAQRLVDGWQRVLRRIDRQRSTATDRQLAVYRRELAQQRKRFGLPVDPEEDDE